MKKFLLGVILASVMVQPVMAGLVPVANIELDGNCYEFSLIATAPVVAAQPAECDGKPIHVKVLYSTRVEAQKHGDGTLTLGSTVYSIVDSDNVYRQLRISDKLPI